MEQVGLNLLILEDNPYKMKYSPASFSIFCILLVVTNLRVKIRMLSLILKLDITSWPQLIQSLVNDGFS